MFQMLQPAGFGQVALGIALEGHATGRSKAAMSAAAREALGDLAETRSAKDAAAPPLHLVSTSGHPSAPMPRGAHGNCD